MTLCQVAIYDWSTRSRDRRGTVLGRPPDVDAHLIREVIHTGPQDSEELVFRTACDDDRLLWVFRDRPR
jgi:hypothetical protein